jgi:type I restriction enzyme S subunit
LDDVVYISADIDAEMAGTRVRSGDVLLNITGASLGRCCAVFSNDLRANVNQHVSILRPLQSVPSDWLAYALESHPVQEQIWATQGGAAREGLNSIATGQLRLPVSTRDEQAGIANHLDGKTTLIATALKRINEQLGKLAEYRQALITAAVTGQVDVTTEADEPAEAIA